MLRQKESASLSELNRLLQLNYLSQDEFLSRLTVLTQEFALQKTKIDKTRQEIYQGYQAQMQLYRCTMLDAREMGLKLPLCRSMEIIPHNAKWRFDHLMIDEL